MFASFTKCCVSFEWNDPASGRGNAALLLPFWEKLSRGVVDSGAHGSIKNLTGGGYGTLDLKAHILDYSFLTFVDYKLLGERKYAWRAKKILINSEKEGKRKGER